MTLDFLDPKRTYTATIYRDGPTAEMGPKGKDMIVERRTVRRDDRIDVRMVAGGGFAVALMAR